MLPFLVAAVGLTGVPAYAQSRTGFAPAMAQDAYGNARKPFRQHRPMDVYQNAAQRRALQMRSYSSPRINRRSGLIPFALPTDIFAKSGLYRLNPPRTVDLLSRSTRQAYERYGGFRDRAGRGPPVDIRAAFTRRQALVQASTLTAPVSRALLQQGPLVVPAEPVLRDRSAIAESEEPRPPPITLGQRLRTQTDRMGAESRKESWRLFADGAYRQAARGFEAAYTLDSGDVRSRIGELFCYLSLGAHRSALALFRELIRRHPTPFPGDFDMTGRYGSAREVQAVRLHTELFAGRAGGADAAALQCFILWYSGDRDHALAAAEALVRKHPRSVYADWPEHMRHSRHRAGNDGETR